MLGAPATAEIDATGLFKQVAQNAQSIQALLEGAPEELDTLKEVADWIAKDDTEDAIVRKDVDTALDSVAIKDMVIEDMDEPTDG